MGGNGVEPKEKLIVTAKNRAVISNKLTDLNFTWYNIKIESN